jgi:hypothetical protein
MMINFPQCVRLGRREIAVAISRIGEPSSPKAITKIWGR